MYKPSNPIRRNIINKLLDWRPTQKWIDDPMKDASILIEECHKLLPYVVVMYHRMANPIILRENDFVFQDCLMDSLPILSQNLREWVLSCPHLKEPIVKSLDPQGNIVFNSKIRYGYLGDGGRTPKIISHFELNYLTHGYPYWLGLKAKQSRVADVWHFVGQWGDPNNVISQRGRSKEDRYAFVYNNERDVYE